LIRSPLLASLPTLAHAHSTRGEGSVGGGHDPAARAGLVRAVGGDPARLVVPHQHHTAAVEIVADEHAGRLVSRSDALATVTRALPLLVQGADCPLVLLHDPAIPALAVVHSGWRGTVARIVTAALATLESLGGSADRIVAAVFPGIGRCCFEVGPEVLASFEDAFGPPGRRWFTPGCADRSMLDLHAAIVHTLLAGGVASARIDVVPGCTACDGQLFSHRGSGGAPDRHGLVAMLV